MNRQLMAYRTNEVGTASQARLVLMMYDGLIRFLKESKKRIEGKDIAGRGLYLSKAHRVIGELQETLNLQQGGEIAYQLERLYTFLTLSITQVNIKGDVKLLDQCLTVVENLREAWAQVAHTAQTKAKQEVQTTAPRLAVHL